MLSHLAVGCWSGWPVSTANLRPKSPPADVPEGWFVPAKPAILGAQLFPRHQHRSNEGSHDSSWSGCIVTTPVNCPHTGERLEPRQLLAGHFDTSFNGTGQNVLVGGFSDTVNAVHALPDGEASSSAPPEDGLRRHPLHQHRRDRHHLRHERPRPGLRLLKGVEEILVRPNGNIVVVGNASPGGDLRVTQLTPDGQLDTTFGSGQRRHHQPRRGQQRVRQRHALDPQGRVVAVGSVRLGTITTGTWAGYVAARRHTHTGRVLRRLRRRDAGVFHYGGSELSYYEALTDVIVCGQPHHRRRQGRGELDPTLHQPSGHRRVHRHRRARHRLREQRRDPAVRQPRSDRHRARVETHGPGGQFLATYHREVYRFDTAGRRINFLGSTSNVAAGTVPLTDLAARPDGTFVGAGTLSGDFAAIQLRRDGVPDAGFGPNGVFRFDGGSTQDRLNALDVAGEGKLVLGGQVLGTGDRRGTAVARLLVDPPGPLHRLQRLALRPRWRWQRRHRAAPQFGTTHVQVTTPVNTYSFARSSFQGIHVYGYAGNDTLTIAPTWRSSSSTAAATETTRYT